MDSFVCMQRHEELSKFLYKKKVVSVAVLLGFLVVLFPVLPVMCCPAVIACSVVRAVITSS